MYYGNSSAGNQENVTGTWNENGANNFKMIQHLQESPSDGVAGHLDSTSNANDGTPNNFENSVNGTTDATGQIDGADDFDGSDDYIFVNDSNSLDITGNITIVMWMYLEGVDTSKVHGILDKRSGTTGYWVVYNYADFGEWTLQFRYGGINLNKAVTLPLNTWMQLAFVYNSSNLILYIDGALDTVGPNITSNSANTQNLSIGKAWVGAGSWVPLNGTIDEVRISNVDRSPDWIETSYNNQYDPSDFLSFSEQVSIPTMTEWGMIIFMVLAGLGSIYYLKRRTIKV